MIPTLNSVRCVAFPVLSAWGLALQAADTFRSWIVKNWRELVAYDETSPSFLRWKVNRGAGARKGQVAGTLVRGYWKLHSGGVHNVHYIIWEMFFGPVPKDKRLDHKDHEEGHNWIWNLRMIDPGLNSRNRSKCKLNKSGVTGVYQARIRKNLYWTAYWIKHGTGGTSGQKYFNIDTLGERQAFSLACAYRAQMIEEQNRLGAGYSDTHGH